MVETSYETQFLIFMKLCLQIDYLLSFCMSDIKSTVKEIMIRVLNPSLGEQFNWKGRGKKIAFQNSYLQSTITGTNHMKPIILILPPTRAPENFYT